MTEFEQALQECLLDLEEGALSVDECLARHPKHARELEPLLLTSAYLARGREVRLSGAFKARIRSRLMEGMYAHPRRPERSGFSLMRLASGLAAILLALLTAGTVYAQTALPGNAFYDWKLLSEKTWRAISPDPVETDLAIAERRLSELIAVRDNPVLYAQAMSAYLEVTARLTFELDAGNTARILAALDAQTEELNQAGIFLPQPSIEQDALPPLDEPTVTPAATSVPVLPTPEVDPTGLSPIVPTIQAPPEPTLEVPPVVIPTVQDPPKIIPTLEIPPPIP